MFVLNAVHGVCMTSAWRTVLSSLAAIRTQVSMVRLSGAFVVLCSASMSNPSSGCSCSVPVLLLRAKRVSDVEKLSDR